MLILTSIFHDFLSCPHGKLLKRLNQLNNELIQFPLNTNHAISGFSLFPVQEKPWKGKDTVHEASYSKISVLTLRHLKQSLFMTCPMRLHLKWGLDLGLFVYPGLYSLTLFSSPVSFSQRYVEMWVKILEISPASEDTPLLRNCHTNTNTAQEERL